MKKNWSVSKLLACGVLLTDMTATYLVLFFCWLSIMRGFSGSLPYLTTLIGALQASTAVVLSAYYSKSKAENTQGGITYDAVINPYPDCERSV